MVIQEDAHTANRHSGQTFGAMNVFSDDCIEHHSYPNFWHSLSDPFPSGGVAFTIDYCKEQTVYAFQLRNSNSGHVQHR